jgi:hypothetical protein
VSMFGRNSTGWEKDMLTWAKTEYGNDWEYAYRYMLNHKGQAPTYGVIN